MRKCLKGCFVFNWRTEIVNGWTYVVKIDEVFGLLIIRMERCMYIVIVSIYHTVTFDYKWFCLCITYKWWYACSMNGYTLWYGSAQDIISRNWIWVRVYICTRPKIWGCFLDSTLVYFIFKPLWFGPKKYCRPFSFDFQSLFDLKSKISLVWNLNPFRAKIENFWV